MELFRLGPFLRHLREAEHLSTRELAQRSRIEGRDSAVTHSQVSNIENEKSKPEFQTLQTIAAALGHSFSIILDGGETDPNTVTILSTDDISEKLITALHRPEIIELLLYCKDMNDVQVKTVLTILRTIDEYRRL